MWNVAAGIVIGGIALGTVWKGIDAMRSSAQPNAPKEQLGFGLSVLVVGIAFAGFIIAKAMGYI